MKKLPWIAVATLLAASAIGEADAAALPERATDVRPLLVGSEAPHVDLVAAAGDTVGLRQLIADGPTAPIVYRGGW